MPKISILVAVYNTAAYLPQCLDSLLSQTLKDIEVLCVDDASTDKSLDILHQYAEKDERVKVFALKENHGIGYARNMALSNASGDYICFVDSDDWLASTALEKVCEAFTDEVDSVLFQVVHHYANGEEKVFPMPHFGTLSGAEAFKESLTWKIHGVYAIRGDIHHTYPYDDTLPTYSDENVTRIHYLKSRKVAFCEGVYYYRQHTSSTTHNISVRRFDFLLANESMRRQLLSLGASEENLRCYETVRWLNLVGVYMFYYLHRNELSLTDRQHGLSVMYHVWHTINIKQVRRSIRCKFGYMPLRFSWSLFRLQEELYFWLRGLVGKNRE